MLAVPLADLAPVHAALAVQVVALVELHVRVAAPPLATLLGLAVSVTVGGGVAPSCRTSIALTQASPAMVVNTRSRVASVVTLNTWSETELRGTEKFGSNTWPSICT